MKLFRGEGSYLGQRLAGPAILPGTNHAEPVSACKLLNKTHSIHWGICWLGEPWIDAAAGTWAVGPSNNYALNPSFEADRVSVTTPAGWTTTAGSNVSGGHTGRWSWQLTGAASLDQQVANLPNGTYTLSAWVKGSGATGAQLYAKGFGGTDANTSLASAGGSWANVTLPGIAVSNGKCQIGISTTIGTITADDLVLVKN